VLLVALTVAIFAIGLFPGAFLAKTEASVVEIQAIVQAALPAGTAP
jgi:hypothetical protein